MAAGQETRPFGEKEVVEMSQAASEKTGKPYGVERVCTVWEQARSTFYERILRACDTQNQSPAKRGPRPPVSDEDLLDLIRRDLAASPFIGEGHRKVWARLHFGQKLQVGRNRVLRIMKENSLLSPYRCRQGKSSNHDGIITTDEPNLMWGTDATKIFTVDDGWVWVFAAVEHWNGECIGSHVAKHGSRFAALEPISQGLMKIYGDVTSDVARGLSLRMDHGSQYLSDHFINQLRFWGITASFAFVEQPQTNGVAERFNRTLKEQAIYGRTFNNIEEVRIAVDRFVDLYNQEWRLEKNGYLTPNQMRKEWETASMPEAA